MLAHSQKYTGFSLPKPPHTSPMCEQGMNGKQTMQVRNFFLPKIRLFQRLYWPFTLIAIYVHRLG